MATGELGIKVFTNGNANVVTDCNTNNRRLKRFAMADRSPCLVARATDVTATSVVVHSQSGPSHHAGTLRT